MSKRYISAEQIKHAIDETLSMRAASVKLGIHFNTFKRFAKMYDLYVPNMGGKGGKKKSRSIDLDEILAGNHPSYSTNKLKKRLIALNIIVNECQICKLRSWLENPITLELDHINGNSSDHRINNLRLLCPNCHSQTNTYRNKRRLK